LSISQYKIDCRITIELLDTESEETANNVTNSQNWSNYVERLANPAASMTSGNSNIEIKQEKPDDDIVSIFSII
jgi:paired amphipathic helix protein Sin3a